MANPTPDVDSKIQSAFLDAKHQAEAQGYGGTAYCQGIQAVIPIVRRDILRELREEFMREQPQGLGSPELIDRFARDRGIAL